MWATFDRFAPISVETFFNVFFFRILFILLTFNTGIISALTTKLDSYREHVSCSVVSLICLHDYVKFESIATALEFSSKLLTNMHTNDIPSNRPEQSSQYTPPLSIIKKNPPFYYTSDIKPISHFKI